MFPISYMHWMWNVNKNVVHVIYRHNTFNGFFMLNMASKNMRDVLIYNLILILLNRGKVGAAEALWN